MPIVPLAPYQAAPHKPIGQKMLEINQLGNQKTLDQQKIQANAQAMQDKQLADQQSRAADAVVRSGGTEDDMSKGMSAIGAGPYMEFQKYLTGLHKDQAAQLTETLTTAKLHNEQVTKFANSTLDDPDTAPTRPALYKHFRDNLIAQGDPLAKTMPPEYDENYLRSSLDAKVHIDSLAAIAKADMDKKEFALKQQEADQKKALNDSQIENARLSEPDKEFKGPAFAAYVKSRLKQDNIDPRSLNKDSEQELQGRYFTDYIQSTKHPGVPKNVIVGPGGHVYGSVDDAEAPPDMSAYDDAIDAAAEKYNVPKSWIIATIMTESAGHPSIKAQDFDTTGSRGLMQVTTNTARGLGYQGDMSAMDDPATSIDYGVKLLGQIREKVGDDFAAAYSAYNSGSPEAYKSNPEVAKHVENALGNMSRVEGTGQNSDNAGSDVPASMDFGNASPEAQLKQSKPFKSDNKQPGNSLGNRIMRQMPDGSLQYIGPAAEPRPAAPRSTAAITQANREADDAKATAQGIISGDLPPTAGMIRTKVGDAVRAELARNKYNLTEATSDWNALQKHINSLNSTQQLRLGQAIDFTYDTLPQIEQAYARWKKNAGVSGIKLINKGALATTKQFGGETGSSAQQLESLIADFTSELGTVYKGGLSSTDESLKLAAQNLAADWNEKTFNDAITRLKTSLAIRHNNMHSVGPAGLSPNGQAKLPSAQPKPANVSKAPAGIDQEDWNYMTDADRALWNKKH